MKLSHVKWLFAHLDGHCVVDSIAGHWRDPDLVILLRELVKVFENLVVVLRLDVISKVSANRCRQSRLVQVESAPNGTIELTVFSPS